MINKEKEKIVQKNCCATCKNCKIGVIQKTDSQGIIDTSVPEKITYECDEFSDAHLSAIEECPHYKPYKNFWYLLWNTKWGFLGLGLFFLAIVLIVLIVTLL